MNKEIAEQYIKWMEYEPIFKEDENLIPILKKYLTVEEMSKTDLKLIKSHIKNISISDYAKKKLSKEEYEFCCIFVDRCAPSFIHFVLPSFVNKTDRNMKDEYIIYCLNKKAKESNFENEDSPKASNIKSKKLTLAKNNS